MQGKTVFICGGLGELGKELWQKHPDNYYVLADIKPAPPQKSMKVS